MFKIIQSLNKYFYILFELVKRQIVARYRASYLGISWAFIEPLVLMLILNFVFGTGLRGGRDVGVPFVTYLITGLAANSYFAEGLNSTVVSVRNNAYLIRKVNFQAYLIPLSQVLASLFVHLLLLVVVSLILFLNKIYPRYSWLEVFYYIAALTALLTGIGYLTSSIAVFVVDLKNITNILTRFLFYLTPIFWSIDRFPEELHWVLMLNPMFYIVTGYREAFFGTGHFWDRGWITLYYWGIVFIFSGIGYFMFKKLRPNFLDVL